MNASKLVATTVSGLLIVGAVGVSACGGDDHQAQNPQGSTPPPPPPPPPTQTAAPPPQQQTGPCDGIMSAALSVAIQAGAKLEAPYMKMDGAGVCGVLAPGQEFASPTITLQPKMCYTLVFDSLPNVAAVDVSVRVDTTTLPPILTPLVGNNLTLAAGGGVPRGSVGGKNQCFTIPPLWQAPVPVKIVLKAAAGTGPISAQLFSKQKF